MGLVFSYFGWSDQDLRFRALERSVKVLKDDSQKRLNRLESMVASLKRIDDKLKEFQWDDFQVLTDPGAVVDIDMSNGFRDSFDEEGAEKLESEEQAAYCGSKRNYEFNVSLVSGEKYHKQFNNKEEFEEFKRKFKAWAGGKFDYL
jgi:hypothetical protein